MSYHQHSSSLSALESKWICRKCKSCQSSIVVAPFGVSRSHAKLDTTSSQSHMINVRLGCVFVCVCGCLLLQRPRSVYNPFIALHALHQAGTQDRGWAHRAILMFTACPLCPTNPTQTHTRKHMLGRRIAHMLRRVIKQAVEYSTVCWREKR